MKNKYLIPLFGTFIIIYWATYVPSLYPVPFNMQIEQQSSETVETCSSDDLDDFIKQEALKSWFTVVAFIVGGIFSGLFILFKVKIGRYIAIIFSLIMLVHMGWYYNAVVSLNTLSLAFELEPLLVFKNEISRVLVCLATIIFLSMPSVAKQFNKNKT